MTALDHIVVAVFAIVYPALGYAQFRRLLARAAAGEDVDRPLLYVWTAVGHWALLAAAVAAWLAASRPLAELGFGLRLDTPFLIGLGLTLVAVVVLALQRRLVAAAGNDTVARIRDSFGRLEIILPRNDRELGRFYALSVTAGIVEETLWRGYLIWYLALFMPPWAAAAASTLAFGLGHAYQGAAHLPKVTLVGALFTGLYLLSGSLWLPMFLHAFMDVAQGRLTCDVLRRTSATAEDVSAAVR